MSFYKFAQGVVRVVARILYRVRLEGLENVPADRGFLLCSNHISNFDPIFVGGWIKPECTFMAKEELFRFKPFGALIRALGAFPVSRGKGDTAAIDRAVELVRSGRVVTIFPEGHRSKTGELLKLKSGAVVVASQTQADILPCAIKKGKRKLLRTPVTVRYGQMIPYQSLGITERTPAEIKSANRLLTAELSRLLEEIHV